MSAAAGRKSLAAITPGVGTGYTSCPLTNAPASATDVLRPLKCSRIHRSGVRRARSSTRHPSSTRNRGDSVGWRTGAAKLRPRTAEQRRVGRKPNGETESAGQTLSAAPSRWPPGADGGRPTARPCSHVPVNAYNASWTNGRPRAVWTADTATSVPSILITSMGKQRAAMCRAWSSCASRLIAYERSWPSAYPAAHAVTDSLLSPSGPTVGAPWIGCPRRGDVA